MRRTPGVEPEDIRVDISKGPLGQGSFGIVFRGTFKGDTAVVLKTANKNTMAAEELLECEMEVRSIQTFFTHPSVSTFDRVGPFQLTGELFSYGMALS